MKPIICKRSLTVCIGVFTTAANASETCMPAAAIILSDGMACVTWQGGDWLGGLNPDAVIVTTAA